MQTAASTSQMQTQMLGAGQESQELPAAEEMHRKESQLDLLEQLANQEGIYNQYSSRIISDLMNNNQVNTYN